MELLPRIVAILGPILAGSIIDLIKVVQSKRIEDHYRIQSLNSLPLCRHINPGYACTRDLCLIQALTCSIVLSSATPVVSIREMRSWFSGAALNHWLNRI